MKISNKAKKVINITRSIITFIILLNLFLALLSLILIQYNPGLLINKNEFDNSVLFSCLAFLSWYIFDFVISQLMDE